MKEITQFSLEKECSTLKFNKSSVLMQKNSSSVYINFILNLYRVYELNN